MIRFTDDADNDHSTAASYLRAALEKLDLMPNAIASFSTRQVKNTPSRGAAWDRCSALMLSGHAVHVERATAAGTSAARITRLYSRI